MANVQRDKKFLSDFAKRVYKELSARQIGNPLRIKRTRIHSTNSDGWAITLGFFYGYQTWAEVWLDNFTSHPTRKIYYCLYSHKRDGLAKLARLASPEFGKHLSIYMSDRAPDSNYVCLTKKLARARFGHPVYERYPDNHEFFYGIYEYDKTGLRRNELKRLVERAVDFFEAVAKSAKQSDSKTDNEIYSSVENRQSVVRHIRRERKSFAATLCKQRDDYICQICRFDFAKAYGELGEDFAEAHHIIPLGSNNNLRSTTVDDLITVCSNCHRMLDRMDGKTTDIKELKRIVRRQRRK